jgi:hypothetical protein
VCVCVSVSVCLCVCVRAADIRSSQQEEAQRQDFNNGNSTAFHQ